MEERERSQTPTIKAALKRFEQRVAVSETPSLFSPRDERSHQPSMQGTSEDSPGTKQRPVSQSPQDDMSPRSPIQESESVRREIEAREEILRLKQAMTELQSREERRDKDLQVSP